MYQTQHLQENIFSNLKIDNQDRVVEFFGNPLDPVEAFKTLKRETNGFTLESNQAKIVDKLLVELLKKNKVEIPAKPQTTVKPKAQSKTTEPGKETLSKQKIIEIEAQQRERRIRILALKLKLKKSA